MHKFGNNILGKKSILAMSQDHRKITHSQLLPAKLRRQSTPLLVNLASDRPDNFSVSSHRDTTCSYGLPPSDKSSDTASESDRSVLDNDPEDPLECAVDESERRPEEHPLKGFEPLSLSRAMFLAARA